ncbi:MAG: KdsC family phosphatase [Gammaproteobacteria bacterium]
MSDNQADSDLLKLAADIRLVIFDVDGVLTDGTLFLGDDGQEYKAFNSRDGLGMLMLLRNDIDIAIITARSSEVVRRYMESRGIKQVYQGQSDKRFALQTIMDDTGLSTEQLAYVGDDLVDLPCLTRVGLPIAVGDAHPRVKEHSRWVTDNPGGRGAAREVAELLLNAQGKMETVLEHYLA